MALYTYTRKSSIIPFLCAGNTASSQPEDARVAGAAAPKSVHHPFRIISAELVFKKRSVLQSQNSKEENLVLVAPEHAGVTNVFEAVFIDHDRDEIRVDLQG